VSETASSQSGEETRIHSLDSLNEKIEQLFEMIKGKSGGASRTSRAEQSEDVASRVRDEVSKLKEADDKEAAHRDEIDGLKQQIAKLTEKAPVEYRPVTKFLWGSDE
jgi:gas vesicle protein